MTAGSDQFFGFTTASPIATVLFSNPNDPGDGIPYALYDNVSFGMAAAVPEASTAVSLGLLLALGLGGVVMAARRKKA